MPRLIAPRLMHTPRLLLSLLALLAVLTGCEQPFTGELPTIDNTLVIEGYLTDADTGYVRLTTTRAFTDNSEEETISGALVVLEDNLGNLDTLQEVEPGFYVPDTANIRGVVGRSYELRVTHAGQTYTAQDTLRRTAPIDSVQVNFFEGDIFDDPGYALTLYTQEPAGQGDAYRWRFFRNGQPFEDAALFVQRDEFVDGQVLIFEFTGTWLYEEADTFAVQQLSLSEAAFLYYFDLIQQSDTSPFTGPGYSPRSNIRGGAFGFFQCSSISQVTGEAFDGTTYTP